MGKWINTHFMYSPHHRWISSRTSIEGQEKKIHGLDHGLLSNCSVTALCCWSASSVVSRKSMKTHIRWMRSAVVPASEEVPPVLIVGAQSAPLLYVLLVLGLWWQCPLPCLLSRFRMLHLFKFLPLPATLGCLCCPGMWRFEGWRLVYWQPSDSPLVSSLSLPPAAADDMRLRCAQMTCFLEVCLECFFGMHRLGCPLLWGQSSQER